MWLKGNLHTHTSLSDGDSRPEVVVGWYAEHDYDFVILTDHDRTGRVERLRRLSAEGCMVINGAELSGRAARKPIHVCALGIDRPCPPGGYWQGRRRAAVLQAMIDWVHQAGGVPLIAHPNYQYALGARELAGANDCRLFELFNASSRCNNFEAGGEPSVEQKWQAVLDGGGKLFGVAADDSHHFRREWFGPDVSPPGRGWVVVEAARRTERAILQALEAGRFYASTEVFLRRYTVGGGRVRVQVEPLREILYTIELVGWGGDVLARRHGTEASFRLRRRGGPVRVRVRSSNGGLAWCQPIFADGPARARRR